MYSIKQKMKLLRELLNPEHAEADLRLLREVSPQNDLLRSPIVNASRSAEKILYTLLDQTTSEKIRLNRRAAESEEQPVNEIPNENNEKQQPENTDPGTPATTEQSEGNTPEHPGEDNPNGDADKADVAQQLEDTVNELEEANEVLENTQSELAETQDALEETQAELEATKEELDAEKKSEPVTNPAPESNKKKTSTRK